MLGEDDLNLFKSEQMVVAKLLDIAFASDVRGQEFESMQGQVLWKLDGHHSSVESSMHTILQQPRVRIPCTKVALFYITIFLSKHYLLLKGQTKTRILTMANFYVR